MHKPRILIVEDQLLISTNIRLLLKFNNYEVFGVAQNAEEAFKMLENERPDLILMDIALPGDIDGIDIANEINKKWNIPLIYITAKKDRQQTFFRFDCSYLLRINLPVTFAYLHSC